MGLQKWHRSLHLRHHNIIDDSLAWSSTIVTRKANFITSEQILVVIIWSNFFQFVLDDELIHTVYSVKRQVRATLVEQNTELLARLDGTVHNELLVLGDVPRRQTDVTQLVVVSRGPSESPRLTIPSRVGVAWRLKGGMHLLSLRTCTNNSYYHHK